jgi:hypothetical protein
MMEEREHRLSVFQSIISRMANNSSNCKLWCITIITGLVVFYFSKDSDITNVWIVLLPIIPFLFLDAYYLGLERYYIENYNNLLNSQKENVPIPKSKWYCKIWQTIKAIFSFSVWGFYLVIAIILKIIV